MEQSPGGELRPNTDNLGPIGESPAASYKIKFVPEDETSPIVIGEFALEICSHPSKYFGSKYIIVDQNIVGYI